MRLKGAREYARNHADLLFMVCWVAIMGIVYLPDTIRGQRIPDSPIWFFEMPLQWLPYWDYTSSMLKQGLMPTWLPHIFCGFPYYSYPATNLYYPPFYLFMFLSYARAEGIETFLYLSLAGLLVYRLCRNLGLSSAVSWIGVMVSAGSVYVLWLAGYGWCDRGALSIALCVYGLSGTLRGRLIMRDWFALVLGLCMTNNNVELHIYFALLFPVLALAAGPADQRVARLFFILCAIAASVFAMFIVFISLAEYSHLSVRGPGVTFSYFVKNRYSPWALLGLITPFPQLYFNIVFLTRFSPMYLGLSALWLAGIFVHRQGRKALALLLATVFLLLMAMDVPPVVNLTFHLPVLNKMILHNWVFTLVPALFTFMVIFGAREFIGSGIRSRAGWLIPFALAALAAGGAVMDKSLTRSALLIAVSLLALAQVFRPSLLGAPVRRAAFAIVFVAADVLLLAIQQRPSTIMSAFDVDPNARAVLKHNDMERFWPVSRRDFLDSNLNSEIGMRLDPLLPGTASPLGYWRMPPMRTAHLINLARPGYLEFKDGLLNDLRGNLPAGPSPFAPGALPYLSLMNVGLVLSSGVVLPPMPGLEGNKTEDLIVYTNKASLPRARAVSSWEVAESADASLAWVEAGKDLFRREAVLESRSGKLSGVRSNASPPEVMVTNSHPGYWDLDVGGSRTGESLVVVSETLLPGWRAFLDGREVPIHYAYHAFMGVVVPAGTHRLKLVHAPTAFRIGLWASIFTMLTWPVPLLAWRRKRAGPGPSPHQA